MKCPRCKLINPDTAQRCDCGYDFETETVERSYLPQELLPQKLREHSSTRSLLIPAVVGLAVFVGLHVFFVRNWELLFAWGGVHDAWWLNSGRSVVVTLVTLFLAAFALLSFLGLTWRAGAAMWVGVLGGMVLIFPTLSEENNLWPIVLFTGGALSGAAILLGAAVSAAVSIINYRRS